MSGFHSRTGAVALAGALLGMSIVATPAQADNIVVTLRKPGMTSPHFYTDAAGAGICDQNSPTATCTFGTENFSNFTRAQSDVGFTTSFTDGANNIPTGQSLTGTYAGSISYTPTNQYGGAQGTTAYPTVFGSNVYHLSLASTGVPGLNYLGVWITAMDASNLLTIHTADGGSLNFTTNTLRSYINQTANPSAYYGNPTASFLGQDSNEPFAYVNFFDTSGYFTSVDFSNSSTSGFESSNHAVGYFNPLTVVGQQVSSYSTPEPAALPVLGLGLAALGFARRSGRRTRLVPVR